MQLIHLAYTPSLPHRRISIISLDTLKQSRICKVDIRTRGGQSYSFGQHCTNGVPQRLDLFPGGSGGRAPALLRCMADCVQAAACAPSWVLAKISCGA